ncbi:hypothetical protein ACFVAJ_11215 [Agromyces sp. NPDC057679]|uniref:hypothetical protein n=1 Tax=Agromyces sp. NPDC057679 TaxID=3346207 RepID=UPI0036724724
MAGTELATAYYSLLPSMDGTAAAVRQQSGTLSGVWAGIGDDAGRGMKGGILAGIGKLALPVTAAFAALGLGNIIADTVRTGIDFAMDGINIAGDIAETKSAVAQVFGDEATASIDKWSNRGADVLGQTQLQALQAAQTFGVFGKAAGLAGNDLATFSTDLADLGTDFASFYNTSPEQAITAIGAALRGESEPIRQYGVLLDEATIKARALSMGIYDGTGSLSQQQRVLAAQAEIFAQSADAQGDFERTSGSLANQQKILAANFENVKAKLGAQLLPVMTSLATFANDKLVPVFDEIVTKSGPMLADTFETIAPALGEIAQTVAASLPDLAELAVETLPATTASFLALAPILLEGAHLLANIFRNARSVFDLLGGDTTVPAFMKSIMSASGSVGELSSRIASAVVTISSYFRNLAGNVSSSINNAVGFVRSLPSRVLSAVGDLGGLLIGSGQSLIQGFIDGISSMLRPVGNAVGGIMDFVAGFFPHSPAERGPFSGSGWRDVYSGGQALMAQFADGVMDKAIAPSIGPRVASAERLAVAAASSSIPRASMGVSAARLPNTITLRVGDREFTAYVGDVAGGVVKQADRDSRVALVNGYRR